jgi:chromosome segregation ATPase
MSKEWGNQCVCNKASPYVPGVCVLGAGDNASKMNDSESKAIWKILNNLTTRLLELEQWTRKDEDRIYDRVGTAQSAITELAQKVNKLDQHAKQVNYFDNSYHERIKKLEQTPCTSEWVNKSEHRLTELEINLQSMIKQWREDISTYQDYEKQQTISIKSIEKQLERQAQVREEKFNSLKTDQTQLIQEWIKHKENHHKWQRDVEEKCCRVMDKNKELQIEVDALKQMIWKLREKIHD